MAQHILFFDSSLHKFMLNIKLEEMWRLKMELQISTFSLVQFDGFEKSFKVASTKSLQIKLQLS